MVQLTMPWGPHEPPVWSERPGKRKAKRRQEPAKPLTEDERCALEVEIELAEWRADGGDGYVGPPLQELEDVLLEMMRGELLDVLLERAQQLERARKIVPAQSEKSPGTAA